MYYFGARFASASAVPSNLMVCWSSWLQAWTWAAIEEAPCIYSGSTCEAWPRHTPQSQHHDSLCSAGDGFIEARPQHYQRQRFQGAPLSEHPWTIAERPSQLLSQAA